MTKQFECTKKYEDVRGFAYMPSWGAHGIEVWVLKFDAEKFRYEIRKGKEKFPSFNTVVLTFSFDAWCTDREIYNKNVETAMTILKEENLYAVARYFNACFGVPSYGGYTAECVHENVMPMYQLYMQDMMKIMKDKLILVHDISNEPLNNTYGNRWAQERVYRFIKAMHAEIKKVDDRPTTVGTQGYLPEDDETMRQGWVNAAKHDSDEPVINDIAFFDEFLDVITLHPYNVHNVPVEEFEAYIENKLERLETLGKPVLITESVWGTPDAESRKPYLESELYTYKKFGIGFSCHTLCTSKCADCFPPAEAIVPMKGGLYMAFLDKNYEIRPHHEIFNEL